MRDASLAELGELSVPKPPMRGQKIFSQGKGLTAAHFLIPDITRNWTSTMLTRRVQGTRRALAKAIDRKERTRDMDPLPMNPVSLVPLKTTHRIIRVICPFLPPRVFVKCKRSRGSGKKGNQD